MSTIIRKAVTFSMVLTLVLVLAACGGKSGSGDATMSPKNDIKVSAAPTAAADDKPVTLKMIEHSNKATNDAVKALNDAFTKKYPNIKVESTVVDGAQYGQIQQTRLAANDVDLLEFNTFNILTPDWAKGLDKNAAVQFIENGDILDITGQPFLQNWDPDTIKNTGTYNGKVYALDIGKVAANGVFYNKKIFADNGLKVPNTWAEFESLVKVLQDKGISPITSGGKDGWPIGMLWYDGFINTFEKDPPAFAQALWTGTRKFNDAATLKIFDKMAEFASFYEKGVTSVDYASVISRFISGKAAMLQDGTWQIANIQAADPNFQFGYFTIPADTLGAEPVQLAGKYDIGYAGAGKTKNKEAVLKWLDFLSQKENYSKFINKVGFIPTMPGVDLSNAAFKALEPLNQHFQIAFEIDYKTPKGLGKFGGFQIAELKVLGGSIATTKELADKAQEDWDTALKAVK